MKFEYQLTNEFCSAEFVRTGVRPEFTQELEINPIESTLRVRELHESFVSCGIVRLPKQEKILAVAEIPAVLEEMQTEKDAGTAEKIAKAIEEAKEIVEEANGPSNEWNFDNRISRLIREFREFGMDTDELKEAEAKNTAKIAQAKERQEKAEAEAKAAKAAEKKTWIEANGSAHLKRAHAGGFNCHRKYIEERAAVDLPGCTVDWDDNAGWGDCACPSIEALDALDAAPEGSQLVWLKESPEPKTEEDYYDEDTFEQCEAIVIRGYLGSKYDIVKII